MTSDNLKSLTTYQKAILAHLGITSWQLKSSESESVNAPKATPNPQSKQKAGLEKLKEAIVDSKTKETKVKSIVDQVLILSESEQVMSPFIKDVLLLLGLESHRCCFASPNQQEQYQDFIFSWQILNKEFLKASNSLAEFSGNQLSSVRLHDRNVKELKKQIWQALQHTY